MTRAEPEQIGLVEGEAVDTVEPPPDVPEAFGVSDASSANWLVRKVIEARAYAKHVKEWAALEVRRAEREERFFLERFGPQLEAWARQQIAGSRRKSMKLPAGTVGFRTEPRRLDVTDEAKLIGWCRKALPSALRIETHLMRSIVKDHVEQTGECPSGAEVGGGQQRFYVR
jgi:hypothetical protein